MKIKTRNILRRASVLFIALALLILSGCSNFGNIVSTVTGATGEFPVEINGVTVSSKPQKVVVLSPSIADVILAIGCETQLTAGSDECDQESFRSLLKINGSDIDAILECSPDLVVGETLPDNIVNALSDAGVSVISFTPASDREDFERLYSQVSSAFLGGGPGYDKGIKAAQDVFTTLDDINRIVPKDNVTTICYLYDLEGSAVTGDMFGSTIMSYAGTTNVFKSIEGGRYDFETLRISNPDFIFCVPGLKSQILADSRFSEFRAVVRDHVYEMDPLYMERQGRTVIMTAYEISEQCFPELTEETSQDLTDPTEDIESSVASVMESSAASREEEEDTTPYETLVQGDQSEDVLKMQTRLEELGYLDAAYDGYYGEYTAECVKEFQKVNGLDETGVANADTLRRLYSKRAKPKSEAQDDTDSASAPEE